MSKAGTTRTTLMGMNEKSVPLLPINTQILSSHAQVQKCGWKNLNQNMAWFI